MELPTLTRYECGYTEQNISQIYRGASSEKRTFPSNVFLFKHPSGEKVLFDTGYAPSFIGTGIKGFIYRHLLRPKIDQSSAIRARLENDAVDIDSITHVVLSHLHPDHIGGVRYFPNAQFILSEDAECSLYSSKLSELVIPKILPEWFHEADKKIVSKKELGRVATCDIRGYDLLGDGSYIVTELPGHARGHLGAFVLNKVLIAADASWGRDLLENPSELRRLPRAVIYDMEDYKQTIKYLCELGSKGIELYFSHDRYENGGII